MPNTANADKTTIAENALAMVLVHEMAHVKYRHPIQALGRGAVVQLVIALISGGQGSGAVQSVLGNAVVDVAGIAVQFVPGYDCLEFVIKGPTGWNSVGCLADILTSGIALSRGNY